VTVQLESFVFFGNLLCVGWQGEALPENNNRIQEHLPSSRRAMQRSAGWISHKPRGGDGPVVGEVLRGIAMKDQSIVSHENGFCVDAADTSRGATPVARGAIPVELGTTREAAGL